MIKAFKEKLPMILLRMIDTKEGDKTILTQEQKDQFEELLNSFAHLFEEPTDLPPARDFDSTFSQKMLARVF